MTYLELVNSVLRKLREDEVTTVAESDYSRLIGDFVNDAKQNVENAWDWSGLRTTTTIDTVVGQSLYPLTGYGVRSEVLYVLDLESNRELHRQSLKEIRTNDLFTDSALGTLSYYAIEGRDANGDVQLRVYQTPNKVSTLEVYAVKRTDALVNDVDDLLVPPQPVVQFAFAYALRERGETGGQSAAEQLIYAQEDLRSAVALDANQRPEELIWHTV